MKQSKRDLIVQSFTIIFLIVGFYSIILDWDFKVFIIGFFCLFLSTVITILITDDDE